MIGDSRSPSADDPILDELIAKAVECLRAGESLDLEILASGRTAYMATLRDLLPTVQFLARLSDVEVGDGQSRGLQHRSSSARLDEGSLQELGDYRLTREIGRGGMGVVYEAEQISLRRRVALKVLPFAAVLRPTQLGRFKNEALAAAALDHPNIVRIYALGCERGVHYFAMQYVDGRTLAEAIEEQRAEGREQSGRGQRIRGQRVRGQRVRGQRVRGQRVRGAENRQGVREQKVRERRLRGRLEV